MLSEILIFALFPAARNFMQLLCNAGALDKVKARFGTSIHFS